MLPSVSAICYELLAYYQWLACYQLLCIVNVYCFIKLLYNGYAEMDVDTPPYLHFTIGMRRDEPDEDEDRQEPDAAIAEAQAMHIDAGNFDDNNDGFAVPLAGDNQ